MTSNILLILPTLEILENGFSKVDYILRDVCLFLISNFYLKVPSVFVWYIFLRLTLDIIANLCHKLFSTRYNHNWKTIQDEQIESKLKKYYDTLFSVPFTVLHSYCMDKKASNDISEKKHAV